MSLVVWVRDFTCPRLCANLRLLPKTELAEKKNRPAAGLQPSATSAAWFGQRQSVIEPAEQYYIKKSAPSSGVPGSSSLIYCAIQALFFLLT